MTNKKMTKMDWFSTLADIVEASDIKNKDEALAFIAHEKELLSKKSGSSKSTKTQQANAVIMTTIKEVLADIGKAVTISELLEDERLATYSEETKDGFIEKKMTNQKMSSMLSKLGEKGTKEVVKTYEKKKAYFSLI